MVLGTANPEIYKPFTAPAVRRPGTMGADGRTLGVVRRPERGGGFGQRRGLGPVRARTPARHRALAADRRAGELCRRRDCGPAGRGTVAADAAVDRRRGNRRGPRSRFALGGSTGPRIWANRVLGRRIGPAAAGPLERRAAVDGEALGLAHRAARDKAKRPPADSPMAIPTWPANCGAHWTTSTASN